jgi:hypothetical protein
VSVKSGEAHCSGLHRFLVDYPLDVISLVNKIRWRVKELNRIKTLWTDSLMVDDCNSILGEYNAVACEWLDRDKNGPQAMISSMSVRGSLVAFLQNKLYEKALDISTKGILEKKRQQYGG